MHVKRLFRATVVGACAVASVACASPQGGGAQQAADLVLTGGRIYTVDEAHPWAEALAVRGRDIVYVGDNEGARGFVGEKTSVEDLGGKFVMPGIIATHEHSIFLMGVSSGLVIEELSHDKKKMLAEVKAYLAKNPDGPYMSYGGATRTRSRSTGRRSTRSRAPTDRSS
jgi:predicted amidohydrolase YtcJ